MLLPVETEWLVPGWLPAGKLTVIFGEPGIGKSMLTLDIAAKLSRGELTPFSTAAQEPCKTLILSSEDNVAATIKPRLAAAGAANYMVLACQDGGLNIFPDYLESILTDYPSSLVIVDPLAAYLNRLDISNEQQMRRLLTSLAKLAEKTKTTFLFVLHQSKRGAGVDLMRCAGSMAIIAAARSVLAVARDPFDPKLRILIHAKSNLCSRSEPKRFHLEGSGLETKIGWDGDLECTNAGHLLSSNAATDSVLYSAIRFLKETLQPGPMPSRELQEIALAQGISLSAYNRARSHVTRSTRMGGLGADGEWITHLR